MFRIPLLVYLVRFIYHLNQWWIQGCVNRVSSRPPPFLSIIFNIPNICTEFYKLIAVPLSIDIKTWYHRQNCYATCNLSSYHWLIIEYLHCLFTLHAHKYMHTHIHTTNARWTAWFLVSTYRFSEYTFSRMPQWPNCYRGGLVIAGKLVP